MSDEQLYDDCGQYKAYQRHKKEDTPVDDACRAANTQYQRELRAKNPDLREREQKANSARQRAANRLIAAHLAEFRDLVAEERAKDSRNSAVHA